MNIDERPLKRSIRAKFQLLLIIPLIILFSVFITAQLKEINSIRIEKVSIEKDIQYELEYKERLLNEDDFMKDDKIIEQIGRDKLGLVKENDIILIRRKD